MEYRTQTPEETQRVSYEIADKLKDIRKEDRDHAIVLALSGDLGSGKTTFVQGLAKALGIENRIVSPTFILMRSYELDEGTLYHLDTYRLGEQCEEEVMELGFEEIVSNPANILIIEWAEKITKMLPRDTIQMSFEYISETERKITYEGH